MRARGTALLVAGLLVVGACADEQEPSGGRADPGRDQATADAALDAGVERLRAAGFEPSEGDDDDEFEPTSQECRELVEVLSDDDDDGLPGETANAESGDYAYDDLSPQGGVTETAELTVGFSDDAAKIDDVLDVFEDERLERCFVEAMEQALAEEPGIEVGEIDFRRSDPDLGDRSGGLLLSLDVSQAGFTVPVELEVVYARAGRGAALAVRTSVGDGPRVATDELLGVMLAELE